MSEAISSIDARLGTMARTEPAAPLLPLEARGLTFEAGGKRIIDGIDLAITQRGVTAIMGANGSGKSVLVRLLHGLLQPSSGVVSWNGHAPDDATRRRQALVLQRPVLLRRSVAANLSFALGLRPFADRAARVAKALMVAGLEHLADQPARVLSGGEQQRLALARALALEPEVLFLDEPTASLDPASVQAIETLIQSARASGVKVVLITHDRGQAQRLAEDVVFLHRGRLTEHAAAARFWQQPASPEAQAYLDGRIFI